MAKSTSAKTNGHTVTELKPAAPKPAAKAAVKPAVKAAAKPAVKAAAKPAVKVAAKPAVKVAAKPAVKVAAKPAVKAAAKPAVKAAAKPAVSAAAKPAVKKPARPASNLAAPAKPAQQAAPAKPAKEERKPAKTQKPEPGLEAGSETVRDSAPKPRLVRDSFTMPEQEYAVLGQVKKACIKAGFEIKKSELLRIGVALISQLDMATLQRVLGSLPQLKTGRPKND